MQKKKILVIRLSSFGDIVLSYNFLLRLKAEYPDYSTTFLTRKKYSDLIKITGLTDEIVNYEDLSNPRKFVRENKFELIFDLQNNFRSFSATLFSGAEIFRYEKSNFKKFILVLFKKNLLKNFIPVYKRYLLTNKKNIILDFHSVLKNFPSEELIEGKYILVSPSSKHFTKRLPKEKFLEILKNINYKIVLTGDDNEVDKEICSYLKNSLPNCEDLSGKLRLKELAYVIKYSQFVICNDSGVLHLAEAIGKKTFVFFGSTVKEFGFYPQLKSTEIFEEEYLECRPCTRIGKSKCPKGHLNCLNKIDTKFVKNKILKYINEN